MISFGEYAAARHALWIDRTYGIPAENFAPAENLNKLRPHHLTCWWRELDRGTLHVINDLQLGALNSYLAVHRTLIYRFFNSYNGFNRYHEIVRQPAHPTTTEINEILSQPGNFSGAYIRTIPRPVAIAALKSLSQHAESISELLDLHSELDDPDAVISNLTLIRLKLGRIPSFGKFLADQLFLDLCWYGNPWSLPSFKPSLGPGALRGLNRLNITFAQALDEAKQALDIIPKPRILVSMGPMEYSQVPVPVDHATVEHGLCEFEKLCKFEDAVEENEGRKVKMRQYRSIDNSREKDSKPRIHPIPLVWDHPKFDKKIEKKGGEAEPGSV